MSYDVKSKQSDGREMSAKRYTNRVFKIAVHCLNVLSNIMPDERASSLIRSILLNILGNNISRKAILNGGGRICGKGLTVAPGVFINRGCFFDLTGAIQIESNCTIGHGVTFITAEHEIGPKSKRAGAVTGRPIVVHEGAWVGANVTILPGVEVGEGSVIGAGSLVTKNVPKNTLVLGVPAKVQRILD